MSSVVRDAVSSILLGYQVRWNDDDAPVALIEKSRRIGLSYGEAAGSVLHAAAQNGANVYYISYEKEMTQGFIKDCASWARAFGAAASEINEAIIEDEKKQIFTYSIRFPSGHEIKAFSSNPRNLRSKGRPGERLVIDEAAFVDDLPELLKSAMAMTMWGGKVRIISTHNGDENPFNELINDIRAGKYDGEFSLHRVTLDDAIEDGLYRRICEVTNQEWSEEGEKAWREGVIKRYRPNEDEELFCIPSRGGGTYLPRAMVEKCMVEAPVLRFEGSASFNEASEPTRRAEMDEWIEEHLLPVLATLNPLRRHVYGMDFARSGHLSVIAPMEIGIDLRKRVPFLVEMRNVPHKQQEQVLFAIVKRLPRFSGGAMDAGGNGSAIAEAAVDEFGSLVEGIHFSESWYRDNMPKFKRGFEDEEFIIPKDDDVLEDHRSIRMVRGVPRVPEVKTEKGAGKKNKGKRHGDSAIAICLADYASRQDTLPADGAQSAGPRETERGMEGYDGAAGDDGGWQITGTGYGTVRNDVLGNMDGF